MKWRPASGYTSKSGRSFWRLWDDDAPAHAAQLNGAGGGPRLFSTHTAAARLAMKLNARAPP